MAILISYRRKDNILHASKSALVVAGMFLCAIFTTTVYSQPDWSAPLNKCWVYETTDATSSRPASDNEHIFFSTSKDTIISLSQSSGEVIWESDLAGNLGSVLSSKWGTLNTTILVGSNNIAESTSLFRQIDSESGVPILTRKLGTPFLANSLVDDDGSFVIASRDGFLEKIGSDGKLIWQRRLLTEIVAPLAAIGNRILVGTGNKSIVVLDRTYGRLLFQINISGLPNAIATAEDGMMFVGDNVGKVYGFDSDFNPIWQATTGAGISALETFGNHLLVESKDNFVYLIAHSSGDKLWKRKLAGRILGNVRLDLNHAVYLTSGASTAVVLDLRDGALVNKIEAGDRFVSGPAKITNGFVMPTTGGLIAISNLPCLNVENRKEPQ